MRIRLGIKGRLSFAIGLTALIPVCAAILLARSMVQQSSSRFFVPEIRERLDLSLEVYQDLARETKATMRLQGQLLATDAALRALAQADDLVALRVRLQELFSSRSNLVSLRVVDADERVLASVRRAKPFDEKTEHQLAVSQSLSADRAPREVTLQAVFVTPKLRFQEFAEMGAFIDAYGKLVERREDDEQTYVLAFSALLGVTIVAALAIGIWLARSVVSRVSRLAAVTRQVGAGDLSVRIEDRAIDEIGDLSRAFDQMLAEIEESRGRIEYLSRLASWQEMARRLAHEIKNPLTPIQLAVQEVHRRLTDLPASQRELLDTTLEIVQAEVQTLRRLVLEFSEFARLPESSTERTDIYAYLRELAREVELSGGVLSEINDSASSSPPRLEFAVPEGEAWVLLDRQMMRRVLLNLMRNAVQACAGITAPHVRLSATAPGSECVVWVDDNGPGVAEPMRQRVFEPYVTTRDHGTGLGLAIVKKIILDHEGNIQMQASPLGGARVCLSLPGLPSTS